MRSFERTTPRTRLSPVAEADAGELVSVFRNPSVRQYLLDDTEVPPEWVDAEIAASRQRFATSGAGLWSVRLAGDTRIIGFVGFRPFFDPPQLQLLYGLLPDYWGQGLATEVTAHVCTLAFEELGFTEILAVIDTPHDASRAVLRRLGFSELPTSAGGNQGTTFFRLTNDSK